MPEINETQKQCLQLARAITSVCFTCSGSECKDETCPLFTWRPKTRDWMRWNGVLAADSILRFCSDRCGATYARCSDRPNGKECPLHTGLRLAIRTFGKVKP